MSNQSTANAKPGKSTEADAVLSVELSYMGFYCDNNYFANLEEIDYEGHLSQIDGEDHLTLAAHLLRRSCQAFALKTKEILGYKALVNKGYNGKGHYVFCQADLEGKIALIDARGVTTSYDKFIPKRPPGTLFDDNPSGRAFVRAPKRPGYGARHASQGWRGRE